MARTPEKTDGRKTRRVQTPKIPGRSPRLERENERVIKENSQLQDQINEMKGTADHYEKRIRLLLDDMESLNQERGALRDQNRDLLSKDGTRKRIVRRLKSEIESLRTERDSYRGALAACDPKTEQNLSERLDGPPTVATVPMVSHSDRDFEEVDSPRWHSL